MGVVIHSRPRVWLEHCLLFLLVCCLLLLWSFFGSTFDKLGEDEWRVVVVGGAFVVIVGLGPVCCFVRLLLAVAVVVVTIGVVLVV